MFYSHHLSGLFCITTLLPPISTQICYKEHPAQFSKVSRRAQRQVIIHCMVGFFVFFCFLFRHSLKRSFLGPCLHWGTVSKEIVWKECWKTLISNLQWQHANKHTAPSEKSCSPTTEVKIKFPPCTQHETSQGILNSYSTEDYLKHLWCHRSNHSLYECILKKPGNFQHV